MELAEPLSGVVRELPAAARDAHVPLTEAAAERRVLSSLEAASRSLACGGAAAPLGNGSPI